MPPLLALKEIAFGYPSRRLFWNFDLELWEGQRIGLMGPNGAGKTTLLRLLVGLERPQKGMLLFKGKPCQDEKDLAALRKEVGFVFQDPDDQLFCPTVAEDLAFGPLNLGFSRKEVQRRVSETLKLLGLTGFEDRVTYRLSGGEKRLVALGTVLIMSPRFLLLDEPTGDLDPRNIEKLTNILNDLDLSFLVVSHDLTFLSRVCHEIYWLEEGRLMSISSVNYLTLNRHSGRRQM